MSVLMDVLRANGGAAPYAVLERAGIPRDHVRSAVRSGTIERVRHGWFAHPAADRDVVRAVRVGGTATAASVARMHGLWVHDGTRLHVRVRHSTGRLSSPLDRAVPLDRIGQRVCVHYSTKAGLDRARDPLVLALAEMFACAPRDEALASIDSALEQRHLTMGHLDLVRAEMPPSRRAEVDLVDPDGQSGLETRIRMLLHGRRIRYRSQVHIAGVGTVDFLVGDRLVIEADGRAWHSGAAAFDRDRRRDFELVIQGYLVLRLSCSQVMEDWERTSDGILALVGRGAHRWAGGGPFSRVDTTGPALRNA
ncbi:endonuclease domain-containing protein [Agromyces sp. MMS24-JH15]|uniref:endonuclease domain-containing protein n=1 Tax=Agromyces sp. MMS24-JH15 TaxID=3243765 RepID=UPI00374A7570